MPKRKNKFSDAAALIAAVGVALSILFAVTFGTLMGIRWLFESVDVAQAPSPSASPLQTGALTISARIVNGGSSSQSYYLDGSYTPRITVIDSAENCVLSLFARAPGDSYGTPIFNDLVFGNAGTFPGPYRQTFTWDSVSFSQESYVRIYNDGGCDEVLLYMSRE